MAWTTFWATKFWLRRRQDPIKVRSTMLPATSTTSTSMRITVPLALFHQPLAPWDKVVHAKWFRAFPFALEHKSVVSCSVRLLLISLIGWIDEDEDDDDDEKSSTTPVNAPAGRHGSVTDAQSNMSN